MDAYRVYLVPSQYLSTQFQTFKTFNIIIACLCYERIRIGILGLSKIFLQLKSIYLSSLEVYQHA